MINLFSKKECRIKDNTVQAKTKESDNPGIKVQVKIFLASQGVLWTASNIGRCWGVKFINF